METIGNLIVGFDSVIVWLAMFLAWRSAYKRAERWELRYRQLEAEVAHLAKEPR